MAVKYADPKASFAAAKAKKGDKGALAREDRKRTKGIGDFSAAPRITLGKDK